MSEERPWLAVPDASTARYDSIRTSASDAVTATYRDGTRRTWERLHYPGELPQEWRETTGASSPIWMDDEAAP